MTCDCQGTVSPSASGFWRCFSRRGFSSRCPAEALRETLLDQSLFRVFNEWIAVKTDNIVTNLQGSGTAAPAASDCPKLLRHAS